ncbi:MAG: Gfo/Idh/MocA family oxidoreductase [Candidatus Omnitrophota bacterium]
MIGVGIAGCGFGASHHGKTITEEYPDKFKLVAFCDLNKERLEQTCNKFGVKGYQDFTGFLEDKEISLVIIATRPHSTHFSLAIKALKTGKDVVVEKPFCITSEEARELLKTKDETKRVLTIHQNRRWDVDYLNVKQVMEEGRLGKLKLIKNYYPASLGEVDVLYEWGSHLIDQVLRLVGGLPERVFGILSHPENNWDGQGFFSAQLIYPDGLMVEVSAVPQAKPFLLPRFYLLGTKGSLTHDWVQRREDTMLKHIYFNSEKGMDFDFFRPQYYQTYPWKILTFYENLYDAITEGKQLSVKPEEGLETILVMEGIIESARSNKPIPLKV